MKLSLACIGALAASLAAAATHAAVIPGPFLMDYDTGWTTAGLSFTALDDSTLTSFTFQNQGSADTIVLTNAAGTILDSIATPAGVTSDTVSVNWALTSGNTYWLLQTGGPNAKFVRYHLPLPSDSDISIIQSGTFDNSIADAVSNANGWGANSYWVAFNNITTAVPEAPTWAIMTFGVLGVGALLRRRRAGFVTA